METNIDGRAAHAMRERGVNSSNYGAQMLVTATSAAAAAAPRRSVLRERSVPDNKSPRVIA